jgi:hypothetical protein
VYGVTTSLCRAVLLYIIFYYGSLQCVLHFHTHIGLNFPTLMRKWCFRVNFFRVDLIGQIFTCRRLFHGGKAISISTGKPKSGQADKIFSSLNKEMSFYEATCTLTPNLKKLLDALLTIRPTSMQNKIQFSTYGIFVTKQRSILSDTAINALCVLKYHIKNNTF